MKKTIFTLLLFVSFKSFSQTSNYQKVWKAINENDKPAALNHLKESLKENDHFVESYFTQLYLTEYIGKDKELVDFSNTILAKSQHPYPYLYAQWFNENLAGPYGKKQKKEQLTLLEKLIADPKTHGSVRASANYQKGMHLLFANQPENAQIAFDEIGNIRNWQFTGPFENLSESGFYKNYGPLDKPEPTAVFKSITNADVTWFSPSQEDKGGWVPVSHQFNKNTAVVYAQTFISSTSDQKVLLNVGASGSVKVWMNDKLIISESKELITDFDAYTIPVNLQKGVNRVLVQLGYSNISYPNFTIRLTDNNYNSIKDLKGSSSYQVYKKDEQQGEIKLVPHFAETYFLDMIEKNPDDLVNYLLLADTYLRANKLEEARRIINKGLVLSPKNVLLQFKLISILGKGTNRPIYLEEVEKLKVADPNSMFTLKLKIEEAIDNEKMIDAEAFLNDYIKLYGEDPFTISYKVKILIAEKKYDELVKQAESLFKLYPENADLVNMMATIKKEVYKDNKGAIKVYEDFLKSNFNYNVTEEYAKLISEKGDESKSIGIKQKLAERFPYDASGYYSLSEYYFGIKNYLQAELYINKALKIAPYNEILWKQLGYIKAEKKEDSEAIKALSTSLKFDPNQYEVLNKVRKINGQPEVYKMFPAIDVDAIIANDNTDQAKNKDYGYYYLSDQKNVLIHSDGAVESFYTSIIKITNEKGVERYKETSIGYNNSQSLLIEKAEVIKKNKAKIEGERNDNEIVFTNLEPGDIIVLKYRIQNYTYGRFANDFWDKYYLNGQIYGAENKYSILVPNNVGLTYQVTNSDLKPQITPIDDYKLYTWELIKPEPIKDESLMPLNIDVAPVLHISTIKSWNDIRNWYADVSNNNEEIEIETKEVYNSIFDDVKQSANQFTKAKMIYDYIQSNIRYSSVSFRQSAYTPQRPSKTLSTRLGDCKDLSSLFVTLSKMAGIDAMMVLVDTRDNGKKDIVLPSVDFNHCIVKAVLDKKEYYIELTNNYLPFASLPTSLNGAIILEIPPHHKINEQDIAKIQYLNPLTRTKDVVKTKIEIKPVQSNLHISTKVVKYGNPTSYLRNTYLNLDEDKRKEEMEKSIAKNYKNNIKLANISFTDLNKLNDSVDFNYQFTVKDEIAEIGSLKTFQINYPDVIATLNQFTADTRLYPIDYWDYEDFDNYKTEVVINLEKGDKFTEIPVNESMKFKNMNYSILYKLVSPEKLVIERSFSNKREDIPANDYADFKKFFESILKAERKFIAYKPQ